jgi:hypothetical protein
MSQSNVERVVGLLVTDEAMRRRFADDPYDTLQRLSESGFGLTYCERQALASIDPNHLERFAEKIDPRLLKADLKEGGGRS